MPPATAMHMRAPSFMKSKPSVSPACTAKDSLRGTSLPLSLTLASAPVTATSVGASKRSSGPSSVLSMTAAPSSLPTSRFASTRLCWSSAPDSGMPRL
jgi:hypothetical protein